MKKLNLIGFTALTVSAALLSANSYAVSKYVNDDVSALENSLKTGVSIDDAKDTKLNVFVNGKALYGSALEAFFSAAPTDTPSGAKTGQCDFGTVNEFTVGTGATRMTCTQKCEGGRKATPGRGRQPGTPAVPGNWSNNVNCRITPEVVPAPGPTTTGASVNSILNK